MHVGLLQYNSYIANLVPRDPAIVVKHEGSESSEMKVTYDQQTDTLNVILRDDVAVIDSDQGRGVVVDYGEDGLLVSIEVLEASSWVTDPTKVDFEQLGK